MGDYLDFFTYNDYNDTLVKDKCFDIPKDYDKYVKVIYQSDPIGEYGIILELTTFDLEAFKKDEELKKKKQFERINIKEFQLDNNLIADGILGPQTLSILEQHLNERVDKFYKNELLKAKNLLNEVSNKDKIVKGNVTNADNVICDIIQGNVINCDTVRCNEIKGNTINCEIYKN